MARTDPSMEYFGTDIGPSGPGGPLSSPSLQPMMEPHTIPPDADFNGAIQRVTALAERGGLPRGAYSVDQMYQDARALAHATTDQELAPFGENYPGRQGLNDILSRAESVASTDQDFADIALLRRIWGG